MENHYLKLVGVITCSFVIPRGYSINTYMVGKDWNEKITHNQNTPMSLYGYCARLMINNNS